MAVVDQPVTSIDLVWDNAAWSDADLSGGNRAGAAPRATKRSAVLMSLLLAIAFLGLLVSGRLVEEPVEPEFAADPNGALFLLPFRGSGIGVSRPGEVSRMPAADQHTVVASAGEDFEHVVHRDPEAASDVTAGARFSYRPAPGSRAFFLVAIDVASMPIRVITASSTDARSAITPVDGSLSPDGMTIRGTRGWSIDIDNGSSRWAAVSWQVTPGRIAKVVGDASLDELVDVAESLELVGLFDWLGQRELMEARYAAQVRAVSCVRGLGFATSDPPPFEQFFDSRGDWFWRRDLVIALTAAEKAEVVAECS